MKILSSKSGFNEVKCKLYFQAPPELLVIKILIGITAGLNGRNLTL
jgi:hypothetical protein